MSASDTVFAGLERMTQVIGRVGGKMTGGKQFVRQGLGDFGLQHALRIEDAVHLGQKNELVGIQFDRGAAGDIFEGQVEGLAGGTEAQWCHQDDGATVEREADGLYVDLARDAGMQVIDAIDHANRPRGDKVA